jgi:hypothetical protein
VANEQVPEARKSGAGAMLPDGFEIERVGALVGGELLIVVVVVGATVVGVTTVVGVGVVVVGLEGPFGVERAGMVAVDSITRACRGAMVVAKWAAGRTIVVGATVVVVVALVIVVELDSSLALGETMFAMAGRAVVLRTIPRTSEPIEPMRTERRGPRRVVEERPLGSPESFCPCVKLVMDQLSKIKSKVLPTSTQQFPN